MTAGLLHDLKRRVVLHPDDAEARFELAEALFGERQFGAAAQQLEKALALAPDHGNARRLLARTYVAEDRMALAERTLREDMTRHPDAAGPREALAEVLVDVGRVDDALLQLEEAARLDPASVERRLLTADLYRRRRLPERARVHLEEARRLAPGDPRIAKALDEIRLELGGPHDLDRGAEFLASRARAALGTPPLAAAANAGPLADVARHLRQGDLRGAKRALVTAGGADPATAELLRGEIALVEGDRDRAENAFRRAVAARNDLALGWVRLGELAVARGATAEAIADYERAVALAPADVEARARLAGLRAGAQAARDDARPVGRIGALGWNPSGGIVSPVEAVAVPGKGELIFSGNVGEVGHEAAKVAFSCLKARADELGVAALVPRFDLHLHFVDTEFAKDGPSAGLALILAGISAFTRRPLRPALAATGEITLHGAVRQVGGIHEKLVAACLVGLRTVLLPRRNLFDSRDLPPEVASRVGLVFVDSVAEALEHALLKE